MYVCINPRHVIGIISMACPNKRPSFCLRLLFTTNMPSAVQQATFAAKAMSCGKQCASGNFMVYGKWYLISITYLMYTFILYIYVILYYTLYYIYIILYILYYTLYYIIYYTIYYTLYTLLYIIYTLYYTSI
jgi:hypothetical protein